MRIAIVNRSCRKVGGVEHYLSGIIPELLRAGHELAFLHELDGPTERDRIALPESVPVWCVSEMGADFALEALDRWRPQLIYMHTTDGTNWNFETVARAPTVFFCHDYVGTCISGLKTFQLPIVHPCARRFGWPCLLHYYPHHCGGWNPATMAIEYRRQIRRLKLLRSCRALITATESMRQEYLKHGFDPETVHRVPVFVNGERKPKEAPRGPWKLIFLARMDRLKGGGVLLDALQPAAEALGPIHATFVSDGPCRAEWEKKASDLNLPVEFTGWLSERELQSRLEASHLLVVPSLWPEPFGVVGLEAGLFGVPAAAFATGGIPEWLHDGVNGYLAPADPPTASGLAEAINRCLRDPADYARLRKGAYDTARRFTIAAHLENLTKVFEKAAGPCPADGVL